MLPTPKPQPNICKLCTLRNCATCPHVADNAPAAADDVPDVDGLTPEQKSIADQIEAAMLYADIRRAASFRMAAGRSPRQLRRFFQAIEEFSEN